MDQLVQDYQGCAAKGISLAAPGLQIEKKNSPDWSHFELLLGLESNSV